MGRPLAPPITAPPGYAIKRVRLGLAMKHGGDATGKQDSAQSLRESTVYQNRATSRDGHGEIVPCAERAPYYPPLMRAFPKAGTAAPTEETSRSFYLTHVALCARDAADSGTIVDDLTPDWSL